jgi:hypothetical protein
LFIYIHLDVVRKSFWHINMRIGVDNTDYILLSTTLRLNRECHYFARYHGHSICNIRFGRGKQKLKRQNLRCCVTSLQQVRGSFGTLSNTNTFKLENFKDLFETQLNPTFRQRVKCFYEWHFTTNQEVLCK